MALPDPTVPASTLSSHGGVIRPAAGIAARAGGHQAPGAGAGPAVRPRQRRPRAGLVGLPRANAAVGRWRRCVARADHLATRYAGPCRAGSRDGCTWPAGSPYVPTCCCSTSRSRGSTPRAMRRSRRTHHGTALGHGGDDPVLHDRADAGPGRRGRSCSTVRRRRRCPGPAAGRPAERCGRPLPRVRRLVAVGNTVTLTRMPRGGRPEGDQEATARRTPGGRARVQLASSRHGVVLVARDGIGGEPPAGDASPIRVA
jgi:hypothetical protein